MDTKLKNNTNHRQTISKEIKAQREIGFINSYTRHKLPIFCVAPAVYHLELNKDVKLLIYPTTLKWQVSVKGAFVLKEVKHPSSIKQLLEQIVFWVKQNE